jgi:hypothetical protein
LTDLSMPSQPIRTTVITDDAHARKRGFPGSPTFLIDDVGPYGQQSQPAALACRLYDTPAGRRPIPDATRLRSQHLDPNTLNSQPLIPRQHLPRPWQVCSVSSSPPHRTSGANSGANWSRSPTENAAVRPAATAW